ncbi:hypothetical protein OSTOST_14675, partial [Ostertagia ostertagi]
MFPYLCVLSITRVLVIKKKMSPSQQLLRPLKVLLTLGWTFTFFVWLWSWFGMAFVFGDIGWEYDFSQWSSIYLKIIELVWCWPAIFVCYFLHLGMILIVTARKAHILSSNDFEWMDARPNGSLAWFRYPRANKKLSAMHNQLRVDPLLLRQSTTAVCAE